MIDPWAVKEPGWEPYAGPDGGTAADGFDPVDTQAINLASFLRAEIQEFDRSSWKENRETVYLPDGSMGILTERAADDWEISIHLRRDFYRVFRARNRAEVLEAAIEFHSAGNATARIGDTKNQTQG
jgi:hypothetical protein